MSAIQYQEFTLLCNGDGNRCRAQYGPFGVDRSRAALRRLAEAEGWTHVHEPRTMRSLDQDFCPAHKPEPGGK